MLRITPDKAYALNLQYRQNTDAIAKAVTMPARQTVYNVWGFKLRQEAEL